MKHDFNISYNGYKYAPESFTFFVNGKLYAGRHTEEAAALAAYYSAGREQNKVDIDYVLKKEVKKPSGAKPGFVVYYTNYSMTISPDISGLKEV